MAMIGDRHRGIICHPVSVVTLGRAVGRKAVRCAPTNPRMRSGDQGMSATGRGDVDPWITPAHTPKIPEPRGT